MNKPYSISLDDEEDILAPVEGISRPQGASVRKQPILPVHNVTNNVKTQKENINTQNNIRSNVTLSSQVPVNIPPANIRVPPPAKAKASVPAPTVNSTPSYANPRAVTCVPKPPGSSIAVDFLKSLQNQVDPQQFQQMLSALPRVNPNISILPAKISQLPVQLPKRRKIKHLAPSFVPQPSDTFDLTGGISSVSTKSSMPPLVEEHVARKSAISLPDIKTNLPLPIKHDPFINNLRSNNNNNNNNVSDSDVIDLTNLEDENTSLPQNVGALNLDTRNAFSPSSILAHNKQVQQELRPDSGLYDYDDDDEDPDESNEIDVEDYQRKLEAESTARMLSETIKRDYDNMEEMSDPAELTSKLMLHQRQALKWMYDQERKITCDIPSGILADDMGLGKTIESIALILANPSNNSECKTTLIVSPLSTLWQWYEEIQKKVRAKTLKVLLYYGPNREQRIKKLKKFDIILTTYQTLAYDLSPKKNQGSSEIFVNKNSTFHKISWYRVILDEAHMIKNCDSRTARAAFSLRSMHRWCLTGTPLQNSLKDLYSLLKFIKEPNCQSPTWFAKNIVAGIRDQDNMAYFRLQTLLFKLLLRRTKDQKLRGQPIITIPPCHDTIKLIDPTEDELVFYNTVFEEAHHIFESYRKQGTVIKNYLHILELLLRLRQCCDHSYLVLMCLAGNRGRGQYVKPSQILKDVLIGLKKGDKEGAQKVITRLFNVHSAMCSICLDEMQEPQVTPCGHAFCKECVEDWLHTSATNTCPMCRKRCLQLLRNNTCSLRINQLVPKDQVVTLEEWQQQQREKDSENPEGEALDVESSDYHIRVSGGEVVSLKSSKVAAVIEELREARDRDPKGKTVVFSQFTMFLDLLEYPLMKAGFKFNRLDGTMTQQQRHDSIHGFKFNEDTTVFLCSLKAGGVGLNLTEAKQVIIMDPWWNPAVEQQAVDRVHRFGQVEDVRVVRFITKKTVEESILELQESKNMLIQGALGGDISKLNQLRIKDLRVLFRWNTPPDPSEVSTEVMRTWNTPFVEPSDIAEAMARMKSTSPQPLNNNDQPPVLPLTLLKSKPKAKTAEQILGTATNALNQQHRQAILKFFGGDRTNPYPHLGSVVAYLLNEEYVESNDKKGYIMQILMELNYLTGEWKKV